MDRREFLRAAAVGAAMLAVPKELIAAAAGQSVPARDSKPNIIFILSDDVGIGNIGCYGSDRYKTPRIDALAKSGIRFEQCYSTPLCGPSRCQSLTGRYPFRTGMVSNGSTQVIKPENEVFMPKMLKTAGYVTASVGKWSQLPLQPGNFGFDEYLRFPGSGRYWRSQGATYTVNGKEVDLPQGKYLPDIMHEFLVDFMTRHRDEPFYIHYPMSHIHGPILRTPDSKPETTDFYTDNIDYMDKLVGKLIDALERLKLREKTLIVFVGDNGTAQPKADTATIGGKRLNGQKGGLTEGGSRVPMIVNWPGAAPAGKVCRDLVDFSDFYPTFAELAGAKMPTDRPIDGHSLAAQVKGHKGKPREWLYVELSGNWYARDSRYKLRKNGELIDLKDAPFAETPVPADTTDAQAIASRKSLQAVLDKLNPAAGKQAKPGDPAAPRKRRKKANALGALRKAIENGEL